MSRHGHDGIFFWTLLPYRDSGVDLNPTLSGNGQARVITGDAD